jgi:iron(III) transport system permease protein
MQRILSQLLSAKVILTLSVVLLLIICIYPFGVLMSKVLFSGSGGALTFKYFTQIFNSSSTLLAIKNTVIISLLTAIVSTILALPLSWIFTRTNLPWAKGFRSLYCLPYAIPPYIGAIAWIYLANPSNGILNEIFGKGFLNVYTTGGLIWVMSTFFYTFVLLSLLAALDRLDPSLEEAARLSGAGPMRVFFQITVPIISPALMSGILLVMLAAAASFGVPAMVGNPARIYLMTTKIYTFQKMGSMSGIYMAGALSTILLVLAIIVLVVNKRILSKGYFQTVSGKSSRPSLIDLRSAKTPLLVLLIILFTILFVLPLGGVIIAALSKVQGKLELANMGLQNFSKVLLEVDETPRAFMNSFKLAFGTATIAMVFGMILSYIQVKTRIKGRNWVELLASLPYSTPGTVLALAFILAFSSGILGIKISLYNTLALIGMAYLAKYLNFSIRTSADGFGQIDDCLAEAARVSGASWWTTMRTIWFPLMKPAMVASWFLVFMPAFSELTMTILLTGPGLETVGTLLFQLQEYGDASGGGAAVLALFIILFVAGMNFTVKILSKGKYGL